MSLQGKTAVVTGGSRGIGRAICLELAGRGANVVLCYSGRKEAAEETARQCEVRYGEACGCDISEDTPHALAVQCDVSDADQVKNLMGTALKAFGSINILVNNAGITRDGLLLRMKDADFDDVIAANLRGSFLCMREVSRAMLKAKGGRIVNISSVVGLHGNAGQINYAASKAGVIGMTKSMAKELGSKGITVNAIAPGFIETDMTAALGEDARNAMLGQIPVKRLGAPEDVARAVAFLVSDDAAYITGQVLGVDGGMGM